jgi:hypothetical protein
MSQLFEINSYGFVFDADVLLTLKGDQSEFEEFRAQAEVSQLEHFPQLKGDVLLLHGKKRGLLFKDIFSDVSPIKGISLFK